MILQKFPSFSHFVDSFRETRHLVSALSLGEDVKDYRLYCQVRYLPLAVEI